MDETGDEWGFSAGAGDSEDGGFASVLGGFFSKATDKVVNSDETYDLLGQVMSKGISRLADTDPGVVQISNQRQYFSDPSTGMIHVSGRTVAGTNDAGNFATTGGGVGVDPKLLMMAGAALVVLLLVMR